LTYVQAVVNHTVAHPIKKINKVKDLTVTLLVDGVFSLASHLWQKMKIFCQKAS